MTFKQFAWVPNGTYDYTEHLCRYVVVDGNKSICISKMWIDQGGPQNVDQTLKQPWGSYPDFPPKPPKKLT